MSKAEKIADNYAPLSAITTKIGSGATPRGGKKSYKTEGIALIRSLNVHDFVFKYKNLARIDDNQASRLKNVTVSAKDILLNITGASVCRCCMVPSSVLPARVNQHVAIVRLDPDLADPHYVLYTINSKSFKDGLLNISMTGATREALTKSDIERFKIPLLPLRTQRKIAAILTAYDDQIETNKRRIALLERMAEELYREWFVRMRFPGHQDTKFVKGVPEGWEVNRLDQLADFENGDRGKNYPRSADFVDTGIPFINAGHLVDGSVDIKHVNRITEAAFHRISRGKIRLGDLLFCVRGSLGRLARVETLSQGAIASSLVIIRASDRCDNSYLFYLLSGERGRQLVAELDNGVAQPNISVQSLMHSLVLLPPVELSTQFGTLIQPIWRLMSVLRSQSEDLQVARNLLLPRLISGKVSVEDLDIQFPPSMQHEAIEPEPADA